MTSPIQPVSAATSSRRDRRGVLVGVVDAHADARVLGGTHYLDVDDVDAVVRGLRLERLEDACWSVPAFAM